jgi:hypothetical protein
METQKEREDEEENINSYWMTLKKTRIKNRHFVPPSFQVYDLKHYSMKCYKVVAVHASKF